MRKVGFYRPNGAWNLSPFQAADPHGADPTGNTQEASVLTQSEQLPIASFVGIYSGRVEPND
jgi:hypothetical protein